MFDEENQNMVHMNVKKLIVFLLPGLLAGCGLLDNVKPKQVPQVTTNEASSVDEVGFTGSGTVVSTGGLTVTERGIVVGLSANPTAVDLKFPAGSGSGPFSADVSGLLPSTTYHFRAYGVNSKGIGYGEDLTVTTTSGVPLLSTGSPASVGAFSASVPVSVINDGGLPITARGVCWSLTTNPTVANSKTTDVSSSGSFVSTLTGLKSSSRIYARAYATNALGTGYGNQVEINTLNPVPLAGLVGRWPLDGNADDVSGKGKNGTIIGTPLKASDRFGTAEAAYDFTLGTNKIRVTALDINQTAGASNSVSMWVKWSGEVYRSDDPGGFPLYWGTTNGGIYVTKFQSWYPSDVAVRVGINAGYGAGETLGVSNPSNFTNNWVHLAVIFRNGPIQDSDVYINGVKMASDLFACCGLETSSFIFGPTSDISIGGWLPETDRYVFLGLIDDVAVFNRALTADEILKIYNGSGF